MLSKYGSLETSKIAVDAVGMSNQIIGNVNIFFSFISAGTAVLIAQNIGAENDLEIKSPFHKNVNKAFLRLVLEEERKGNELFFIFEKKPHGTNKEYHLKS